MNRSFQEVLEDQDRRLNEALATLQKLEGSVPQESIQEFLDALDGVGGHTASVGAIQLGIRV